MSNLVRIGIVGMGGYAQAHHEAILRLEREGLVRLVCTCDPRPEAFDAQQEAWSFRSRDVRVYPDLAAMLASCSADLDVVVVSTPIPLHLEMHRRCVEAGVACYLEKPPTLNYLDLKSMIATDAKAVKRTLVGFNYIAEPARLALKRRLLLGEFGAIRRGSFTGLWRRPPSYFSRNSWGGRLKQNGALVLDSCFGNAMSHFVHNLLFWTGSDGLFSWGEIAEVRAALWRVNAIESADTFFVETQAGGVPLRFALSHACEETNHQVETLVCERATIRYVVGGDVEIECRDGSQEVIVPPPFPVPEESHRGYLRYFHGEFPRPSTTLEDCRPFVILNDLAYVSSRTIGTVPAEKRTRHVLEDGSSCAGIAGLKAAIASFVDEGLWPDLSGSGNQAIPQTVTPAELSQLPGVIDAMLKAGGRRSTTNP